MSEKPVAQRKRVREPYMHADVVRERTEADLIEGEPFPGLVAGKRVHVAFESRGEGVTEPEGLITKDVRERGFLVLRTMDGGTYKSNDRIESLTEITSTDWKKSRRQEPPLGGKLYIAHMHHGRLWIAVSHY